MPRLLLKLRASTLASALGLVSLLVFTACPKSAAPPPADPAPTSAEAVDLAAPPIETVQPSGPPPERYATLPPGAFDAGASAEQGSQPDLAGEAPGPRPADPGLVPNAGSFNLTGVRIGMNLAEVEGRYPPDSGWAFDKRFAGSSETGVVMAKPRDTRARASELFYLLDGSVVAFLRAVQEDGGAYEATVSDLARALGAGEAAPPQWSRGCTLLRSWRSSANETAKFWGDQSRHQVLTAGHSASGRETVYMLFDIDLVDQVQQELDRAGQEPQPEPDRSWNPPVAPPPAPGGGQ